MFEESLNLFEKYRQQEFQDSGRITAYAGELGKRIGQVTWILGQAQDINSKLILQDGNGDFDFYSMRVLEIHTESFYHFTWRIIEITKKNTEFKLIPRCGIYDVRNHLIQHVEGSEKKNEAKSMSMFSAGVVNGPIIKGYIGPDNSIADKGLFENAKEFEAHLNATLKELIKDA